MTTTANETKLAALAQRVREVETQLAALVGPTRAGHVPAVDAAIIDQVAETIGTTGDEMRSASKRPERVAQRRAVVRTLRERLGWSWARIARGLGKSETAIRRLA